MLCEGALDRRQRRSAAIPMAKLRDRQIVLEIGVGGIRSQRVEQLPQLLAGYSLDLRGLSSLQLDSPACHRPGAASQSRRTRS